MKIYEFIALYRCKPPTYFGHLFCLCNIAFEKKLLEDVHKRQPKHAGNLQRS